MDTKHRKLATAFITAPSSLVSSESLFRYKIKRSVAGTSMRCCHFQIKTMILMPDLLFDPRLEVNAVGEMGPQTVSMNLILLLEFRLPK